MSQYQLPIFCDLHLFLILHALRHGSSENILEKFQLLPSVSFPAKATGATTHSIPFHSPFSPDPIPTLYSLSNNFLSP